MPRVPLLRVVLPYVTGILLEDFLRLEPILCGVGAALGLCLWRFRAGGALAGSGECLLGIGLGALALSLRLSAPIPSTDSQPTVLTLLRSPSRSGLSCRLMVYVHSSLPGPAYLGAPPEACQLLPGARAVAKLELGSLRPATNPGASSRRDYWARRGVRAGGRVRGQILPVGDPPRTPRVWLERARRRLGDALDPPDWPGRSGGLLRALATGDRTLLDEDVRGSFSRAGVAHLLAVSGLHVGWVFAVGRFASGWLLKATPSLALLRRATSLSMVAGTLCALGYALLTGPGIPALRASAMAFAGAVAVIGGRRAASWNGLALAVLVVVALEPASVFAPAFQLSFAAVSGIILWHPKPGKVHSLLHCALAASLATAPFVALLGAPLPLAGLLANLVAVPLFGAVLVPLALAVGTVAALNPALGEFPLRIAHLATEIGIRLVGLLESPDVLAAVGDRVTFALGLAVTGFGVRLLHLGRRVLAVPVLFAALVALGVGLTSSRANTDSPTSLLFLDVGHGDSILVRSGIGAWLIDTGPQLAGFDAGRYVVVPALRAEGVRRLNALVLTHSDRDHIGGAVSVLRAVDVDELWMSRETVFAAGGEPVRRQAARSGVPIRLVAAGDTYDGHGLKMSVLWPPPGRVQKSSNRASLVLRISSGERCAMLPGDVPVDVERVLARASTPCEVLKLSHHGSASSSATAWLDALAPKIAVVSAGRRARSPLPHPLVRRRVREAGIELWETSRSGAIRIGLSEAVLRAEPFLPSGEARR